jgi:hypothetical protein
MIPRMQAVAAALTCLLAVTIFASVASAEENKIRVGAIDAWLSTPAGVEQPPVALLIAGSGSTDHDGNGPQVKPATLKKLSDALIARGIATLRYDKRGAGGWKQEFGKPEDFRFRDYVDDATALVTHLRAGAKFSKVIVIGHSEGGLVGILAARRIPVDKLVLLAVSARKQGDLLKAQLEKKLPPEKFAAVAKAIDSIVGGDIVDPPPPGFAIPPSLQAGIASAFREDPIPPLQKIEEPILIVAGGKDSQLARVDFLALTTAAFAAKTLWVPEMNHALVDVSDEADDLAAYNQPERPLDADMIAVIADFILAKTTR